MKVRNKYLSDEFTAHLLMGRTSERRSLYLIINGASGLRGNQGGKGQLLFSSLLALTIKRISEVIFAAGILLLLQENPILHNHCLLTASSQ